MRVRMKNLTAAWMIIAMSAAFAPASFAEGDGGCVKECEPPPPPPEPTKGNNGWGNGIDGDNPGTPKGATADTKKNEVVWDKFIGKHDGR